MPKKVRIGPFSAVLCASGDEDTIFVPREYSLIRDAVEILYGAVKNNGDGAKIIIHVFPRKFKVKVKATAIVDNRVVDEKWAEPVEGAKPFVENGYLGAAGGTELAIPCTNCRVTVILDVWIGKPKIRQIGRTWPCKYILNGEWETLQCFVRLMEKPVWTGRRHVKIQLKEKITPSKLEPYIEEYKVYKDPQYDIRRKIQDYLFLIKNGLTKYIYICGFDLCIYPST